MSSGAASDFVQGKRVVLLGKLASMSKRDAAQLLRSRGAVVIERLDDAADLAVLGEEGPPLPTVADRAAWLDDAAAAAIEAGRLQLVTETQLWQQLGLVEHEPNIQRLYTPAMLAGLLGVDVAVIRRWHRRKLIVPAHEVRRLPYFDFQEVAAARRLAELLAAGVSPRAVERQLAALGRALPGVARPLAQLAIIIHGKEILLRQGAGLVEPGGQFRFDFEAPPAAADVDEAPTAPTAQRPTGTSQRATARRQAAGPAICLPTGPEQLCRLAAELEDDGQLPAAAEMYRAAMAAGGPKAELCFQVAELLYRLGDLGGARERYYTAIELDEDYVEARANLGCLLAEMGERELAVAAFEGALQFHPDYADVHYHLARTLDELGRRDRGDEHWAAFLELAPESPWADEARARLAGAPQRLFS